MQRSKFYLLLVNHGWYSPCIEDHASRHSMLPRAQEPLGAALRSRR